MKFETVEELMKTYEGWKRFEEEVKKAGYKYLTMFGWNVKPKNHARITNIGFDEDDQSFSIEYEGGCGCCPPDTYETIWLPMHAIVDIDSYLVESKLRGDFDK